MATTRKPRPEYLTRAEAEAMIAAAIAAERRTMQTQAPLVIKTAPTMRRK